MLILHLSLIIISFICYIITVLNCDLFGVVVSLLNMSYSVYHLIKENNL